MDMTVEEVKKYAQMIPGNIVIYLVDENTNLKRIYYSETIPSLTGFTNEEYKKLEDKSIISFAVGSDAKRLAEKLRACLNKGEKIDMTCRFKHKTNTFVWMHIKAHIINTCEGKPIVIASVSNLSEETKSYNTLLDSTDRSVYVVDSHSGEILYANKAFDELFGSGLNRCVGKKCNEVICKNGVFTDKCVCVETVNSGKIKETFYSELGKYFEFEGENVVWGEREAYAFFISDVTEKRLTELKINENTAVIKAAVTAAGVFYFEYDPDNLTMKALYKDDVRNFPKFIVNYPESIIRKYVVDECYAKLFRDSMEKVNGGSDNVEFEIKMLVDNKVVWLHHVFTAVYDIKQREKHILSVVFDVTTQKEAETAYENHLDMLMQINEESVSTFRINLSKNLCGNGLSEDEELLHLQDKGTFDGYIEKARDFIPFDDQYTEFKRVFSREKLIKEFNKGKNQIFYNHVYRRASESIDDDKIYTTVISLAKNPETRDIQGIIFTRDITEIYKKDIEQMKKLEAAVLEAEKANEAKTMFMTSISHDLRTPLNAVLGFAEVALETDNEDERKKYLKKISASGEILLGLINDTLSISKIETGKMTLEYKDIRTVDFIKNLFDIVNNNVKEKNIKLKFAYNKIVDCVVKMDEIRTNQILLNVLSNAIKFTRPQGNIFMSIDSIENTDYVLKTKTTIRDNGVGMSEEFLPHIFESFTQEDAQLNMNYSGTGLGMSITKGLVELMGGRIEVKSKLGEGTEFCIYLDFEKSETKIQKQNRKEVDLDVLKWRRILYCEDHPLNRELGIRLLKKYDASVETAHNGSVGLEMFINSVDGYYDAILMDIRMPVMDGLQTARAIRKLDRNDAKSIPIIATTANAYDEDRLATQQAGMTGHISKPINITELYSVLANQIEKYRKIK